MQRDRLRPEQAYWVESSDMFAYSPDGVGLYWYDTRTAMTEDIGPVRSIIHVTEIGD